MTEAVAVGGREPRGWMIRLVRMPNIFVDPAEIFDREAREPNAFLPLLVLCIGLGSLLLAYAGPMINIALSAVPAADRPDLVPAMTAMVQQNKWVGLALTPVYIGASALAVGILIFAVVSATAPVRQPEGEKGEEDGGLHRAISIAAYASLAILVEQLLTYTALRIVGFENVHYFWDLKPLPGLHYLVANPDVHRVAFAVLERINFFTIVYGCILAYGTRRVFRTSRLAAATAAIAAVLGELFVITILAWLKS
jgi:Yip1-like protein